MTEITPHLGLPLVAPTNNAAEDATRLRQAMQMIDAAVYDTTTAISQAVEQVNQDLTTRIEQSQAQIEQLIATGVNDGTF